MSSNSFSFLIPPDEDLQLVLNYFSQGQTELARMTLFRLHKASPELAISLLRFLIVNGPPTDWMMPSSTPTAAHFTWFLCTILFELSDKGTKSLKEFLTPRVYEQRNFELLLAQASEHVSKKCLKEFRQLWTNDQFAKFGEIKETQETEKEDKTKNKNNNKNKNEKEKEKETETKTKKKHKQKQTKKKNPNNLTKLAKKETKNLLLSDPELTFTIFSHFGKSKILHKALQEILLSVCQQFINNKQWGKFSQYLKYLDARDKRLFGDVTQLFKNVLSKKMNSPNNNNKLKKKPLNNNGIYQSLLCCKNPNYLTEFCTLEDAFLKDRFNQLDIPDSFHYEDPETFWSEFWNELRVTNKHGLEFILTRSRDLITSYRVNLVEQLLVREPFRPLASLVFLLCWPWLKRHSDYIPQVIEHVWNAKYIAASDPLLRQACFDLQFNYEFGKWALSKIDNLKKNSNLLNKELQNKDFTLEEILEILEIHSPLYFFEPYLPYLRNEKELLKMISIKKIVNFEEEHGKGKEEKEEEKENKEKENKEKENKEKENKEKENKEKENKEKEKEVEEEEIEFIQIEKEIQKEIENQNSELKEEMIDKESFLNRSKNEKLIQLLIIQSFFCIRNLISIIQKKQIEELKFQMIQKQLNKIWKLDEKYMITILQTIFSLIFLREQDIINVNSIIINNLSNNNENNINEEQNKNQEKSKILDIFNKSKENIKLKKHDFLITRQIFEKLLNLFEINLQNFTIRSEELELLEKKIFESKWRFGLIKTTFPNLNDQELVPLLISTPETLLIISLKQNNYKQCHEIINFFSLKGEIVEEVKIAEAFDNILSNKENLNKDNETNEIKSENENKNKNKNEDNNKNENENENQNENNNKNDNENIILKNSSNFFKFKLYCDLAISCEDKRSIQFLNKANYYLEQTDEIKDQQLINSYSLLINRYLLLSKYYPNQSLQQILSNQTEQLPKTITKLKKFLKNKFNREKLLKEFQEAIEKKLNTNKLLQLLADSFNENLNDETEDNNNKEKETEKEKEKKKGKEKEKEMEMEKGLKEEEQNEEEDGGNYFSMFLNYIINLGKVLNNQKYENYLDILNERAEKILFDLIYIENDFNKAIEISKIYESNLISIIINEFTKLKSENNESFPLTIKIVEFIYKHNPLVSILACLFLSPKKNNHKFLEFALDNSQEFKTLNRYIKKKIELENIFKNYNIENENENNKEKEEEKANKQNENIKDNKERNSKNEKVNESFEKFTENFLIDFKEEKILKVVSKLEEKEDLIKAVEFADKYLIDGTPQNLLIKLIENTNNNEQLRFETILRINEENRSKLILKYINNWDIDMCLSALQMSEELDNLKNQFVLFKQILDLKQNTVWKNWHLLKDLCENEPEKLIHYLVKIKEFEIAKKVTNIFNCKNYLDFIDQNLLLYYITTSSKDTSNTLLFLISLGKERSLKICQSVLSKLIKNEEKLFLIQFIKNNLKNQIDENTKHQLENEELSLKILINLPLKIRKKFQKFSSMDPSLMLEILLMNKATSIVKKLSKKIPQLYKLIKVKEYSEKAIDFTLFLKKKQNEELEELQNDNENDLTIGKEKGRENKKNSDNEQNIVKLDEEKQIEKEKQDENGEQVEVDEEDNGDEEEEEELKIPTKYWLNGNTEHDEKIRKEFYFSESPSLKLTKAFLELCSTPTEAGTISLQLCDLLSQKLSEGGTDLIYLVSNLMKQLYLFAKLKFLDNETLNSSMISTCDSYLNYLELLERLMTSNSKIKINSISDFSDPKRARILRDKLLLEDNIQMAMDLATRTHTNDQPVWEYWGLKLLKLGKYQEAREKFKHCLISYNTNNTNSNKNTTNNKNKNMNTNKNQSNLLMNSNQKTNKVNLRIPFSPQQFKRDQGQNQKLLSEIIVILESRPPLDLEAIRQINKQMINYLKNNNSSNSSSGGGNINNKNNTEQFQFQTIGRNLTIERFDECIYYINTYGTDQNYLTFLTKHGRLVDAIEYIINNDLNLNYLIKIVLQHCLTHASIPKMLRAFRKIDPTLIKIEKQLMEICKFLNQKKIYTVLHRFQSFMKDEVRAAYTRLMQYHEATTFKEAIHLLSKAKNHFIEGLNNLQNNKSNTSNQIKFKSQKQFTRHEIDRQLKTVSLQIEIENFLKKKGKTQSNFLENSLFSNAQKRATISQNLIVLGNNDLAFQIIQEYRLPTATIYENAAINLVKDGKINLLNKTFDSAKGTMRSQEWDRIILKCISIFVTQKNDSKTAKKYLKILQEPQNRLQAFILLKNYKQAFNIASSNNWENSVKKILNAAQKDKKKNIIDLCSKWLSKQNRRK
ncbi:zinc finger fyve domain protein [Anaeramoeba flamelloides]|uniref:Zinc finger fyve domain protein n=1 Tax=Anaeramoeba flamelloides TaxID=1746091 RepID=A0ABQ8Z207_9EUKA|nr:zinc finger fyve domain protein [Anaeramoeba flamelloides]